MQRSNSQGQGGFWPRSQKKIDANDKWLLYIMAYHNKDESPGLFFVQNLPLFTSIDAREDVELLVYFVCDILFGVCESTCKKCALDFQKLH